MLINGRKGKLVALVEKLKKKQADKVYQGVVSNGKLAKIARKKDIANGMQDQQQFYRLWGIRDVPRGNVQRRRR
uniref:Uncharacterized protein n=1 Tax=Tanacetum cinerariifolium TaxID=118510 RepID=A0A6L2LCV3_TANCI|nr:hypothetical protein [Tanacetum cinerariifolium]